MEGEREGKGGGQDSATGNSTPAQGLGTVLCRHQGYFRTFAEASPEFRSKPKASVTSDKVVITLAQRMLILCKGPKDKI